MGRSNKYNLAKKDTITIESGATLAGANASNEIWLNNKSNYSKRITKSTLRSNADIDNANFDNMAKLDIFEGDYTIMTEEEVLTEVEDTHVKAKTGYFDNLTFSEAFHLARQVYGSGGSVFEWHGNFYNTYTREEYENLNEEDMNHLYQAYKQATKGDINVLISSLERTIANDSEGISNIETILHHQMKQ